MSESGRCHRALVVEDDPAIRRLVEKLLTRRNIEIDVASDGAKAIEQIRTVSYSIVILDLMVPEVDGFAVIDFIREQNLGIPVAVVSAVSQHALRRLDPEIVKLVISKPFDVGEFTTAIETLCSQRV